jgi:hypothetical protein
VKTLLVRRDEARADALVGCVLCQDIRNGDGHVAVGKGRILAPNDVAVLMQLAWNELHLLTMDAGDVHEDAAGVAIAAAAAGARVTVGTANAGHWPLVSTSRGILSVSRDALRAVNGVEGVCVYTLYDGQVIADDEIVARAKITPFVLERQQLDAAIGHAAGGLVHVRPFVTRRIGAVVQETLGGRAIARFRDGLGEKVQWFGSVLLEPRFVAPSEEGITAGLRAVIAEGAELVTIAGTKAMDALDPAFRALDQVGARMERHGVPAHPGSLFWLAYLDDVPVLGMPTCGLFSQATVFDLLLPRLLAGEHLTRDVLADLGHGGFLTRDMAFRFPPYRATHPRGELA